ncbi:MAG: nucleotidyltransferase family protein [Chitinophagaceae bacterium]|jgi:NDP-sugar pyrophosphorylase family protein
MLFAAGLGTRLKPFTDHHPKALAEVNGKSLLERNILYLQHFGINELVVNVHHFADQIEDKIKRENGFGSIVNISDERHEVLETGGGLLKAAKFFNNEDFIVMNADMLTNFDLNKLIEEHKNNNALATLAVQQRDSSRQLLFNDSMQLCGWKNKINGETKIARVNEENAEFAFSGIQIIHTDFFKQIEQRGKFSIIESYLQLAKHNTIKGLDHSGDILLDVGKPESLHKAAALFN